LSHLSSRATSAVDVYAALKPLLFRIDPAAAHSLAMRALALPEHAAPARALVAARYRLRDPSLEVRTMGLLFPNPIGVAGGFDKEGKRARALAALGFGHVELGTVTAIAQAENPPPNLFRLPDDRALVNRLGFPNAGASALAARLRRAKPDVPVGVSIGKSRVVDVEDTEAVVRDYEASFAAVRDVAEFVVVNVSSPNTPNLRAMQRAESAETLLTALTRARAKGRSLPLLLKVAPDLDDEAYDALLGVVKRVGFDGVIAANTTIRRDGLRTPGSLVSAIGAGGMSGPLLFPRALAMVRRAREALGAGATVIGVGGVSTSEHVRAMRDAGADLCQLYTAFIYEGPSVARRILEGLLR
jgi:dihydroorotate dehydrogenase